MTILQHTRNIATSPAGSLRFKKLELSDRPVLEGMLSRYSHLISGFTFAALFSWAQVYRYSWALCDDGTILIAYEQQSNGETHFLQPVGPFGAKARQMFLQMIAQHDYPVRIVGVSAAFIAKNPDFMSHCTVQDNRDVANYIYRAPDLATLGGKFYAKKRNLIAQAHKLYQYSVHDMTAENSHECLKIPKAHEDSGGEAGQMLENETLALQTAIKNFAVLSQQGIVIRINDQVAAFSIFEPLSPDMCVVHFEKADLHYKGLYQIINQETAKVIAAKGFALINREEDLGIAGLRQAKLSYGPVEIMPSYILTHVQR